MPEETLSWRVAADSDVDFLATWNHQLIQDEGHRNPMSVPELSVRLLRWIRTDYRAVLFSREEPLAYALYRAEPGLIHLRHFFVRRDRRRRGIGRAALVLLRTEIWPRSARLTVDVLVSNPPAVAFWRSVGYRDYSLTLEIPPG